MYLHRIQKHLNGGNYPKKTKHKIQTQIFGKYKYKFRNSSFIFLEYQGRETFYAKRVGLSKNIVTSTKIFSLLKQPSHMQEKL